MADCNEHKMRVVEALKGEIMASENQSPAAASAVRHSDEAVGTVPTRREGITGAESCNVQYDAAAGGGGAQPGSSFSAHSSQTHGVMATSLPLAGEKSMHVSAERNSTWKPMIPSSLAVSTFKDSAIMATTNEVPN